VSIAVPLSQYHQKCLVANKARSAENNNYYQQYF